MSDDDVKDKPKGDAGQQIDQRQQLIAFLERIVNAESSIDLIEGEEDGPKFRPSDEQKAGAKRTIDLLKQKQGPLSEDEKKAIDPFMNGLRQSIAQQNPPPPKPSSGPASGGDNGQAGAGKVSDPTPKDPDTAKKKKEKAMSDLPRNVFAGFIAGTAGAALVMNFLGATIPSFSGLLTSSPWIASVGGLIGPMLYGGLAAVLALAVTGVIWQFIVRPWARKMGFGKKRQAKPNGPQQKRAPSPQATPTQTNGLKQDLKDEALGNGLDGQDNTGDPTGKKKTAGNKVDNEQAGEEKTKSSPLSGFGDAIPSVFGIGAAPAAGAMDPDAGVHAGDKVAEYRAARAKLEGAYKALADREAKEAEQAEIARGARWHNRRPTQGPLNRPTDKITSAPHIATAKREQVIAAINAFEKLAIDAKVPADGQKATPEETARHAAGKEYHRLIVGLILDGKTPVLDATGTIDVADMSPIQRSYAEGLKAMMDADPIKAAAYKSVHGHITDSLKTEAMKGIKAMPPRVEPVASSINAGGKRPSLVYSDDVNGEAMLNAWRTPAHTPFAGPVPQALRGPDGLTDVQRGGPYKGTKISPAGM